jgi:hypothetical protein
LFFICHSTGGIVVRYMLERWASDFEAHPVGVALIASPSLGSAWADLAKQLATFYKQRLGLQLRQGSDSLNDLDERFRDLVKRRPTMLLGGEAHENRFILHGCWLPPIRRVVEPSSAGRGYWGAPVNLPGTDHFTAVKPRTLSDRPHTFVIDVWTSFIDATGGSAGLGAWVPPEQPMDRGQIQYHGERSRRLWSDPAIVASNSGWGTAFSIANPYQQAAAQLTAEVTMVRSGVSRLRYVAGPPGSLKTKLLEDVAGRVDGQLVSVMIDAAQDDDLAKFYAAVSDSLAAFGIDCRRSDAASIRNALRDTGKKLLLLVDSYHSYFINADRNDRAAVARWFVGLKELEKDGNAFVLMAGSVNPTHWYVSQFSAGQGSAPVHVSPQPLGESFEETWSGRIAKEWSLDGTRLQRVWQRAEGHPRSFLEGASALASGRDPDRTVEAWQQWAGNAAPDVVPSCCRDAMRLAASGGDVAQRANCRDALLDARFLRKNEQNVIVPALSMWNTIWRNIPA